MAQLVIYPLEIAKTRLAVGRKNEFKGIGDCIRRIVRYNTCTFFFSVYRNHKEVASCTFLVRFVFGRSLFFSRHFLSVFFFVFRSSFFVFELLGCRYPFEIAKPRSAVSRKKEFRRNGNYIHRIFWTCVLHLLRLTFSTLGFVRHHFFRFLRFVFASFRLFFL